MYRKKTSTSSCSDFDNGNFLLFIGAFSVKQAVAQDPSRSTKFVFKESSGSYKYYIKF